MLNAFVSGIFPRQDELIGAINRYERKRIGREELQIIYEKCEKEWMELQKGLTYISEPSLAWNDIFRPFTLHLKNIETGPLTRYMETNTFYRRPIFKGKPVKEFDILEMKNEYSLPYIYNNPEKIFLPGPYTFVKSGDNETGLEDDKLVEKVAEIIFDEASKYRFVEFREPFIRDIDDLKELEEIYATFSGKGFVFTTIDNPNTFLDFPLPYAVRSEKITVPDNVILELVDVFSTRVTDLSHLNGNIKFTTNESLEFLPYSIAVKKIESMKISIGVK